MASFKHIKLGTTDSDSDVVDERYDLGLDPEEEAKNKKNKKKKVSQRSLVDFEGTNLCFSAILTGSP